MIQYYKITKEDIKLNYITYHNDRFSHELITKRRKSTPIHYHDDYELYFLVDGETKFFVEDEIFYLHNGDFIFIPRGVYHKTDSEDCLHNERILLAFEENIFDESMSEVLEILSSSKLICIPNNNVIVIKELLDKIKNEHSKNRQHKDAIIEAYIKEILILLCRFKTDELKPLNEADKFIYSISEYISNNITENITLKSLSDKFSVSQAHLSRKFKKTVKTGINEYIKYVRILHAQKLLSETTLPITEIAEQCGFNDSNYFSTTFKKAIGASPVKYRKSRQNS